MPELASGVGSLIAGPQSGRQLIHIVWIKRLNRFETKEFYKEIPLKQADLTLNPLETSHEMVR